MYSKIEPPQRVISKDAVKVWRISELIESIVVLAILGVLYFLHTYFEWKEWIDWIIIGLTIISVFSSIWTIIISPTLKQKHWRYDVDEEFMKLKYGAWNQVQELVPMTKIQSVELDQGPLLRKYGLYTVKVGTMGTSHVIPALPEKEAYEIRDQIAHFAKVKEVE